MGMIAPGGQDTYDEDGWLGALLVEERRLPPLKKPKQLWGSSMDPIPPEDRDVYGVPVSDVPVVPCRFCGGDAERMSTHNERKYNVDYSDGLPKPMTRITSYRHWCSACIEVTTARVG